VAAPVQLVFALLCRYAAVRDGRFSRADFVAWGAHHGMSRRTPCETIDVALRDALAARVIRQVQDVPTRVFCLYQYEEMTT
jgi:hypothetical protein